MPHRTQFVEWLLCHLLAIAAFTALGVCVASINAVDLSSGFGGVFRRELLMTSGAWGSWMFLAMARTPAMLRLARFTVLVPGLAMIGMTAFAFSQGWPPDRWVQWLLAGALALSLAASRPHGQRHVRSHPAAFLIGIAVSVGIWWGWYGQATVAGDPTMGFWLNAPVVAVLTSTWLPRAIAGRPQSASASSS